MAIDFTTSTGRVRLLTADTNESAPIFTDLEIAALLDLNNQSIYASAADACRIIAMDAVKGAIAYKIMSSEFNVDKKKIPEYYLALAADYDDKADLAIADDDDCFVDWGTFVSRVDGRDETEYEDDENQQYWQDHYWEGDV